MRLSTRGRYGVAALYEVALRGADGPVALREVAEAQGISENYLEQLFLALRRAGLVQGVRGAQGGYVLTRHPADITIGDAIRALEGPIAPVSCVAGEDACARQSAEGCVTRPVWVKLAACMSQVLDSISLADLLEGQGVSTAPASCNCQQCNLTAGRMQQDE